MNDLQPHKHGDEGTHYACGEALREYGMNAPCCGCSGHECKEAEEKCRARPVSVPVPTPETDEAVEFYEWGGILQIRNERGIRRATINDVMAALTRARKEGEEKGRERLVELLTRYSVNAPYDSRVATFTPKQFMSVFDNPHKS